MKQKILLLVCYLAATLQVANAGDSLTVIAENATGWNRLLGEVRYQWDFLTPPLDMSGMNTVGVHDPGGSEAIGLTPFSPLNEELASLVDPFLNVTFPGSLTAFPPDPAGRNVPLRDVGTWTTPLTNSRTTLPFQTGAAAVGGQSQAGPSNPDPITLGDWLQASGRMHIRCRNDGTARLWLRVRNLIPNRAYTVWAMWHLANGRNFPQPFGGVPNAYITDSRGNGLLIRELNYCPIDAAEQGIDNNRLLSIITHLHSDHILYGGVPVPTGSGFPPGSVLHVQLEWNFPGVGVRLID